MSSRDHLLDARTASDVMDAGSPSEAKETVTRYRKRIEKRVTIAVVNAAARIRMDGKGMELARLKALVPKK
jgi:hypothetical protein